MSVGFVALNSYTIADTYFVGQLGTLQLAAIGFTFPVAFTMVAIGLGIGIGTSSVIARLLGTGDHSAVQRITTHALLLGGLLGMILLAIGLATIDPVFRALGADDRTLPLIREYMRPYYLGSVLFILPMVGNFSLRAAGDSKVPAIILSLSALVNLALDPLLIFGLWGFPRLELQGAAIATVLANALTVIASLTILYRRERMIRGRYVGFDRLWDSWRRLLHVGMPATATNLLLPITFAAITAMVAVYGPESVAGFAVASRVESIVLIAVFALQASVGPIVGQNYGAGHIDRVRRAISLSNRFLLIYTLLLAGVLFVFARSMVGVFSDSPVVVETAVAYLRIVPVTYGAFGLMMIAVGGFNSLGRPMPAAVLTFVKFFIVYLPLAYILSRLTGITGIFWANAVSHLLFGIASLIWISRALKALETEDGPAGRPSSVDVATVTESNF